MRASNRPWAVMLAACGAVALGAGCSGSSPRGSTGSTGNFHPTGSGTTGGIGSDAGGCSFDGEPCALPSGNGECCGGACSDPSADPSNCGVCGSACDANSNCCSGTCMNVITDPANCGFCGNACPGSNLCCSGSCVDTTSDPNNCGSCAYACSPDLECCGGGCSDPTSDSNNCGSCGSSCPSFESCESQSCVVVDCTQAGTVGAPCFPDGGSGAGICCASACVDISSDAANCGGCGDSCPATTACQGSNCTLPNGTVNVCPQPGAVDCSPGATCVAGAGRCATLRCSGEADDTACAEPNGGLGLCCGSVCIDPTSDANNCAVCGNACGEGNVCSGGTCVPGGPGSCTGGLATSCALGDGGQGECCGEGCIDSLRDSANCGGCGNTCAPDESCVGGACWVPSCGAPSAQGLRCGRPDGGAGVCCGGECLDFGSDESSCGGCGEACPGGSACVLGSCAFADGGAEVCPFADGGGCAAGEVCLPTSHRCVALSCGGAADAPPPPPRPDAGKARDAGPDADAGLDAGTPDAGTPDAGRVADAGSEPDGGAEPDGGEGVDAGSDAGPPDAGPADAGAQDGGSGDAGSTDAGPDAGRPPLISDTRACAFGPDSQGMCCGGGCIDLASDPNNCGGCGLACPSGQICLHAACAASSPCDSEPDGGSCPLPALDGGEGDGGAGVCCGTGCVDLAGDPSNCGGCGRGCASGEACGGGRCGLAVCDPSHAGAPCFSPELSDGGPATDGGLGSCCGSSCIDTRIDPQNCGGCGLACGGTQRCTAGQCGS